MNVEKLKRGQRPENWKENCEKFPEYYKKNHPDWSEDDCIEAAKKFNRSINWQCVEFYQKKFPEKSLEECEALRKEAVFNKRCNSQQYIEYYQKRFPNATEEEWLEMLKKYTKENSFQNIEYYQKRFPNATEEEWLEMLNKAKKNYLSKRPNNSGENNPGHKSKTTELERRQRSPKCIEFYELRYPNLSKGEYEKMVEDHKKLTASRLTPEKHSTKIEYWLAKGYTEEEAKEQLSKRQRTFDLNYCIKKYGLEEGTKRFNDRQNKWLNSFKKSIKNASKNGITSSNIANNFFNIVESIINGGEREVIKGKYSFDFVFKNKIIEFNGDYWHMNPKIYDEKYVNKTINMTAQEVWERDKKKLKYAKNHNYDMYVVWESDYKNNPDETLKKCIKFLTS